MLIKQAALSSHLKKACAPIYILIGQDEFLMMQTVKNIKSTWKNRHPDSESLCYTVEQPQDWEDIYSEADSYHIFSQETLIDVRFNKKTLDAKGKTALTTYLASPNPKKLILIQAPLLNAKHLSFCSTHQACVVVQIFPLHPREMRQWISDALKNAMLSCSSDAIELILQYTSGNHLACAQLIEKLGLIYPKSHTLSLDEVRQQLSFQCNDHLFDLPEACLYGDTQKAIRCIRVALSQKTEPVLILWIVTQEIRLLIQLQQLLTQGISFNDAASKLKIWSQRHQAYQKALGRLKIERLYDLLRQCQNLDQNFKLGKLKNIHLEIEQLLISITQNL
jgi:DNA polymerase III subunit delta